MAKVVFVTNKQGIDKLMRSADGPAVTAVRRMQVGTSRVADKWVPVNTGALKGSKVETPIIATGDKVVGGVEYRQKYAMFVHGGTKAHTIRPRRKKVRAWVPRGGGKTVFAGEVQHPGTKAKPWLKEALKFAAKKEGFSTD